MHFFKTLSLCTTRKPAAFSLKCELLAVAGRGTSALMTTALNSYGSLCKVFFFFFLFFSICSDSKHLLAVKEKTEREAQALLLRVRFQVMKNPLHSLICCLHGQDQKVHLKVDSISPLKLGRFIYRRRVMIFTSLTRVRDMQGFSNIFKCRVINARLWWSWGKKDVSSQTHA